MAMGESKPLGFVGVVVRGLWVLFLVFATYNFSGYSYYHWVMEDPAFDWALKMSAGGALGLGLYSTLDNTRRSLHRTGLVLTILASAGASFYFIELGAVDLESWEDIIFAVQINLAIVCTVGLCFSHIHYRIGGVKQVEIT